MSGPLGCGEHRVLLQERGGGDILTELPWDTLRYGRKLDEISEANVSVGLAGVRDDDCCWALGNLQAWEHELAIWRDNTEVWVGVVGEPEYTREQVVIPARDLFTWFEVRVLPVDRTFTATDLGDIFQIYADDALAADNSMGIVVATTPVGVIGDRQVAAVSYRRAADELRELARSGIDWTMIGRTMLVGGEQVPTTASLSLVEDDILDPKARIRGFLTTTEAIVVGGQGHVSETPVVGIAGGVDPVYGLVQRVTSEPAILDDNSAFYAADAQLAFAASPPTFVEGRLDPNAGFGFEDLIPGTRADLRLDIGCRRILDAFRLQSVDVAARQTERAQEEEIAVVFVPLGTESLGS